MKNIFIGPDATRNYLDMAQHEPTSCVELPYALAGNPTKKVRMLLKMMGPESALHTFKIVPTYRWFAERAKEGVLTKDTTVVMSSSGGAGLAGAAAARAHGVKIIVLMPEDTPLEKQVLIRRVIGEDGGELVLTRKIAGQKTGVQLAREMGRKEHHLVFDQYGDDVNWQAHRDVTIGQVFEQAEAAGLKVGLIVAAMGTTGTLLGAREYCKEHSPETLVVGVMTEDDEPIPAVRSEKRLVPDQILFDWKTGTHQVKVSRYRPYQKTVQALRYGLKVGLSTGAAMVGADRFIEGMPDDLLERIPSNEDGSRIAVVISGDILDPYLNQLRVILDPEDL